MLPPALPLPPSLQKSSAAYARVMKDAHIAPKIQKLIAAGILRTA
jgi:hypothetical protein